jgi:hypothetical protein
VADERRHADLASVLRGALRQVRRAQRLRASERVHRIDIALSPYWSGRRPNWRVSADQPKTGNPDAPFTTQELMGQWKEYTDGYEDGYEDYTDGDGYEDY